MSESYNGITRKNSFEFKASSLLLQVKNNKDFVACQKNLWADTNTFIGGDGSEMLSQNNMFN